jgi:UDP-N-acetylmuramoyl-tripeptide--D-alanyl-D-alanine ligase
VLGDMLELGPTGPALHFALGEPLLRSRIDLIFAGGPLMRHLFDALPTQKRGAWAENAEKLQPLVAEALRPGDVVMVKGSNGSRMHALVAGLKTHFAAPEKQEIQKIQEIQEIKD